MAGDPYFYQTQLLVHARAGVPVDSSYYARVYTKYLYGAPYNTSYPFAGTGNSYSNGSNAGYNWAMSTAASGTSDFTLELFLNPTTGGHSGTSNMSVWQLGADNTAGSLRMLAVGSTSNAVHKLQYYSGTIWTDLLVPTDYVVDGLWSHLAVTRSGNLWTYWLNGVAKQTATLALNVTGTILNIFGSTASYGWSGSVNEIRHTIGVARYTSTFAVPTEPFPSKPDVWQFSFAEGVQFLNEGLGYRNQYQDTQTEALNILSPLAFKWGIQWKDQYEFHDVPNTRLPVLARDTASFPVTIEYGFLRQWALSDSLTVGESLQRLLGLSVAEGVQLQEVFARTTKMGTTAADTAYLRDVLTRTSLAALSETIGTHDALVLQRGLFVTDRLGLAEVWAPAARMGLTQVERVQLVDALRRFFGGDAVDSISLGDAVSRTAKRPVAPADTLALSDTLGKKLVLRVIGTDTVGISDVEALKTVFRPEVLEQLELAAAFVTPNGGVTTWAINVVNGAVTEYGNYAFNSFAQLGDTYLGATSSGLYELQGDTDDGTAVLARIKSGLMQMAGSNFTQFKGAYLGIRGEGEFVLRLITGDDEVYDYGFEADSMRTTRVVLGKGLRARYFAFELLTEGQDFDVDTVEFIPLMNSRRV